MPISAWLCEDAIKSLPSSFHARHDSVFSWLSHAPSPPSSTPSDNRRKRLYGKQHTNGIITQDLSPSKRRRLFEVEHSACATKDVERTPQAKPSATIEPPPHSSYASSGGTTHSRRSCSPKKRQPVRKMANLSLLPNPVVMKSINDPTATLPEELEHIVLKLRRISRGLGVISRSEKDAIASMSFDRSFRQILTDELAFADNLERQSLGPCPQPHEVAKAVSLAIECESNEHSEASWNGRVHTYLLDLALYNEAFRGKVGFLDCTKARIEPETLLPLNYTGLPIKSKMVDFALYLEPDDVMHDALRQLAARDPIGTYGVHLHRK